VGIPNADAMCRVSLMDHDDDIDQDDLWLLVNCFSGPAMPFDESCLP